MDRDKTAGRVLQAQVRKRVAASDFVLDVDFRAAAGFTIVFGASGAGKTTLLDCIAGLIEPDSGRIAIGGQVLFDAAEPIQLPVEKRNFGYVFQDLALFPHLTVEENVEYGLSHLPSAERNQRTAAI
ncbi:MAG: ATP-binding cassette domain-containing protein, partial [Candidatus Sulfotelmatobacter sp.]